jgi:uncharacterized membrane protein
MRKTLFLLALLASAVLGQARPRFLITQITYGFFSPAEISAGAINNEGQVTGTLALTDPFDYFPYFYSGGQTVQIPTVADAGASAINNHGVVVGSYIDGQGIFIWPGMLIPFGPVNSYANGINDSGTVVGGPPAYVYQAGVLIDLGLGANSVASAINNLGQVVASDGSGNSFLWQNGKLKSLPPGIGGKINNKGDILGTVQSATGTLLPVLYKNGVLVKIRLPAGSTNFELFALNDKDHVVGTVELNGTNEPFLWNGGFWLLNKLIPAGTGWVLQEVGGINNKGQITASGTLNGDQAACILTPQ